MRTISILILSLLFSNLYSQEINEKEINTKVNEATVFLDGAQVIREKSIYLAKGKTIVKFVNLSPFIDAKSIQVKAEGELTVLSVNHQQNYLKKSVKSKELSGLENQLEVIEEKISVEFTTVAIIEEELAFLRDNRNIGGKNEQVNMTNLQLASEYYGSKLTSLKMKEIEHQKTLKDLNSQLTNLQNQIKVLTNKKEFPTGEILVKVDANHPKDYPLQLSYMVGNAGWFPSYDIRAKNINEPVQLVYKANVKQDTKIDWNNVKIKFSSADPNVSGVAPTLKPYYINYNTEPPTYKDATNSVRGRLMDSQGEPLPGATIRVEGTTIGTIAEMDGSYSISIPGHSSQLTFSYIGYVSQTLPVSGEMMNVYLAEDQVSLDEVVITGYGIKSSPPEMEQSRASGLSASNKNIKIRGTSSQAIPTVQVENQTTVDFKINTPYSIKSDNRNYSVDMAFYDLPAFYQYYCAPKIDKDAFLIANIVDWEKFKLLEGEANLFFEDTYVGKTLMDVRYASDTLEISLGRDKNVSVSREKFEDFTDKQFIGNKQEVTRAWKTTVKNNKDQAIHMIVLDQVPVSTIDEIEVNVQNISGARQDIESGEIKWEFELEPANKKEFELKYSIKYPKYRDLYVE